MESTVQPTALDANGYLKISKLVSQDVLSLLKSYYEICERIGRFSTDAQCPLSKSLGHDAGFDAVLNWLCPAISAIAERELTPTYSYTRIYGQGDVLSRHVDRPACEITVSICITIPNGYPTSPLFLQAPGSDTGTILLSEGDACVYKGTEIYHWRDAFPCYGYCQLFLHYITPTNPLYYSEKQDGRSDLGITRV